MKTDTKDTTIISFRVSPDELETLDTEAAKAGTSRTDHIRSKLFRTAAHAENQATLDEIRALIKHAIIQINQTHVGLYSIAEAEGEAKRFLSTQELRTVYDRARAEAISYAVEFPEKFTALQAEIAAARKKDQK
jgi:hypothetical protein